MPEASRTLFAQEAVDMADLFRMTIGAEPIQGEGDIFDVAMTAPEGVSTGGGVQAAQHLTLKPRKAGAAIVVGVANKATLTAELRTPAYLAQQWRRRTTASLPVDPVLYKALFDRMSAFFASQGFIVNTLDAAPEAGPPPPKTSGRRFPWGMVLVGLVTLAMAYAIWRGH